MLHLRLPAALVVLSVLLTACAAPAPPEPTWTFGPAPTRAAVAPAIFTMTVHRSPSCGCCHVWEDYLSERGASIEPVDAPDLAALKTSLGIPESLWSCHTAVVKGYIVEGHVPLEAIERLLAERPAIDGIALAGMPSGSPGMPGPKEAPFRVEAFVDGTVQLFGEY
jgi:hypothetical protein